MASSKTNSLSKKMSFEGWKVVLFVLLFGFVGVYAVWEAWAAPNRSPQGTCSYANRVVSATGLPKYTVINFIVTDNTTGNRTGWVLGQTDIGEMTVNVPEPKGSTTYDFTSKTWGKNGSKFTVYAECLTSGS